MLCKNECNRILTVILFLFFSSNNCKIFHCKHLQNHFENIVFFQIFLQIEYFLFIPLFILIHLYEECKIMKPFWKLFVIDHRKIVTSSIIINNQYIDIYIVLLLNDSVALLCVHVR